MSATTWEIREGDCVEAMQAMPAESIDAIVCDPPYDLTQGKKGGTGAASINLDSPYGRARIGTGNGTGGFMGKAWDGTTPRASGNGDAGFAANGSHLTPSITTSPERDGFSTADADPAISASSSRPSSSAEICPDCGGVVKGERRNAHPLEPTVKPIALMRWLCRLVTPPGGTILDPFAGSGTTGCAAVLEGFDFIGLEREPEYVAIARARIAYWAERRPTEQLDLLGAA